MMATSNPLEELSRRAARRQGWHLTDIIQKELLHYDILYCMEEERLLDDLVFQGGTALRMCYGAPRHSVDLDFVGGVDFSPGRLAPLKRRIESHVGRRYGLKSTVREPRVHRKPSGQGGVEVSRWWVSVVTEPLRKDKPHQKVKLEIANVPALTSEVRRLRANYDFLPDGYEDLLVPVESREEIMADKVVALAASSRNVRYRDIWDLAWLQRKGVELRPGLVQHKIRDYGISLHEPLFDMLIERLPSLVAGRAFKEQMSRFLTDDRYQRSFGSPKFEPFVTHSLGALYGQVKRALSTHPSDRLERDPFEPPDFD